VVDLQPPRSSVPGACPAAGAWTWGVWQMAKCSGSQGVSCCRSAIDTTNGRLLAQIRVGKGRWPSVYPNRGAIPGHTGVFAEASAG
jgi:hypothetical protein